MGTSINSFSAVYKKAYEKKNLAASVRVVLVFVTNQGATKTRARLLPLPIYVVRNTRAAPYRGTSVFLDNAAA